MWVAISAIATAFWSRFMGLLSRSSATPADLRSAGGCRGSLVAYGGRTLGGDARRGRLLDYFTCLGRVDLDARAHGGRERDRAQVAAFGGRRLGADELFDDGGVVLEQLALVEADLADDQVDDGAAVGAVLDLAGLGLFDGLGDVHGDGADFRVGHLAGWPEDAPELADDGHHVGGGDGDVEVVEALLDAFGEILGADDVGAGLLGLLGLVALREHGALDVLAAAIGQGDGAAQLLVGVAHVEAGAHVHLDGLVELGAAEAAHQRD